MKASLVRVVTSDSMELQGLHYVASATGPPAVVFHLPGIWGNFYENPFIDYFADFYPAHGYSFMTVNTRDHDAGAIEGRFEDCAKDIQAWLNFAAVQGYRQAVLQGHSLGGLKAVYYLQVPDVSRGQLEIGALILLSPFDNIAFYSSGDDALRQQQLAKVRAIAANDPSMLVPRDVWDMWMLSAGTYLELVEANGTADIFPFRRGTLEGTALSRVTVPVFAAVGGEDFAAFPSPKAELEQLSELPEVHAVLIEGAPHNFAGREPALVDELSPWLESIAS